MELDQTVLSYKQKSEISHSLVGKWPSKNKGTRDASVGRSNYTQNVNELTDFINFR